MQTRSRFRLFYLLILFFPMWGCGLVTKEAPKVQYPNKVSPEMKADFDRVEDSFKAKQYKQAEAGYQAYIQRYPYNELTDLSNFRLGQISMLRSQYGPAAQVFSQLIQKTPDPSIASRARVKAGICQYRLGSMAQALSYFDKAEAQYVQDNDRIKLGSLALAAISKSGGSEEAKGYYYAVLLDSYGDETDEALQKKYGSETVLRPQVIQGLESWAKRSADINQIDFRFKTYRPNRSAPYVDYKLGMAYYASGNTKLAKKYLGELVAQYSGSSLALPAKQILDKIGYKPEKVAKGGGKVFKVGVILPLSGK